MRSFERLPHKSAAVWQQSSIPLLVPLQARAPRTPLQTQPTQASRTYANAPRRGPVHRVCVSSVSTSSLRESTMPNSIHGPQGAGGRSIKRLQHSATIPHPQPAAPSTGPGPLPDLLTVEEAAAWLRCSVPDVRRKTNAGIIPSFRIQARGRILIPADYLRKLLPGAQTGQPQTEDDNMSWLDDLASPGGDI